MKTIAVATQKGGTGKTTTAAAVASCIKRKGLRVLLIDLDQQRNLSRLLKAETTTAGTSLALLLHAAEARDIIQRTEQGDIIAAGKNLQAADIALKDTTGKEYLLRDGLAGLKKDYDFIILDCPPALGVVTVNALTAADLVIIPAEAAGFSMDGMDDIADTIKQVKKYCNRKLKIGGILLTRYEPNSNLSKAMIDIARNMAERLNTKLFATTIRNSVKVREAQLLRQDLFAYAAKSNPALDYEAFTEELLQDITKGE